MAETNYKISLSTYNPQWKEDFLNLKQWYTEAFGSLVEEIHHVGSTSIEGMSAKPRIDIDIEATPEKFDQVRSSLEILNYEYRGDLGIPRRYAFKYIGSKKLVPHNLYVCPSDSRELQRHLAFRDYLRSHPESVKRYSAIKHDSIAKGFDRIEEYMNHKGQTVVEILVDAMYWADIVPKPEEGEQCEQCGQSGDFKFNIRYLDNGDKQEYFIFSCRTCDHNWEVIHNHQ